ncbi:hypothetical protein [Erwinia psidii]|nr:hypothetical protein [Erwinia psidii]
MEGPSSRSDSTGKEMKAFIRYPEGKFEDVATLIKSGMKCISP